MSQVWKSSYLAILISISILDGRGGAWSQDIDKVLERADQLLNEAKASYESAREKASVQSFVEAGFKLEEARIKYLVVQEIGSPDKQKLAADRLRAVNQLNKLINDGKVAVMAPPAEPPASNPGEKPVAAPVAPVIPEPPKIPAFVIVRKPVPEESKQREAEKLIKELFKEQYAKKAPADRRVMARALLEQASKNGDDPPGQWVLLREAQDSAVQGGDLILALQAVEFTARVFDVEGLALKHATLLAVGKGVKTPEESLAVTLSLDNLVDELVSVDQYDLADKSATAALQHAKRANDPALAARLTAKAKDVAESKAKFQSLKSVFEAVAKAPDNPAANLDVGKFLCFFKGNWDLGVRFLAKGSDAALKGLAEKELARPTQESDMAALGDGWSEFGQKEKNVVRKERILLHARHWYREALTSATGLRKAAIEKRLRELAPEGPPGSVNLLKLILPATDAVSGQWELKDGLLVSNNAGAAKLAIPYEPPEEYDFKVVFTRLEGSAEIIQALTKAGKPFAWQMALSGTQFRLFNMGNAKNTSVTREPLQNGRTYTSLVQVRKDGVKVLLDGKVIVDVKTDFSDVAPAPVWRLPSDNVLGVGSHQSATRFHQIEVIEVKGKGRLIR